MVNLKNSKLYRDFNSNKNFKQNLVNLIKNSGKSFEYLCRSKFEKEGYTTLNGYYKDFDEKSNKDKYRELDIFCYKKFRTILNTSLKDINLYPWVRFLGLCKKMQNSHIIIQEENIPNPNLRLYFPYVTEEFNIISYIKYGLSAQDIIDYFEIRNIAFKIELLIYDGKKPKLENDKVIFKECVDISKILNYYLLIFDSQSKTEIESSQYQNNLLYDAIENYRNASEENVKKRWKVLIDLHKKNFQLFTGVYLFFPILITDTPIIKLKNGKLKDIEFFIYVFTPPSLDEFKALKNQAIPIIICNENYLPKLLKNIDVGLNKKFQKAADKLLTSFDYIIEQTRKYYKNK